MDTIFEADYFYFPRLNIVPPDLLEQVKGHPLFKFLVVRRLGFFPNTQPHRQASLTGGENSILLYCSAGEGFCKLNREQEVPLKAGQAVLIPARTPYEFGSAGKEHWTVYWMHVEGDFEEHLKEYIRPGLVLETMDSYRAIILEQFVYCFHLLQHPCQLEEYYLLCHMSSQILSLLIYANKIARAPISSKGRKALKTAVLYMREHLQETLTLEELAQETGFSCSHLTHLFKTAVQYTPVDYFLRLKVQAAAECLSFSDAPVKEIASTFGINDPFYFSRLFKKVMGVSPSHYRESLEE